MYPTSLPLRRMVIAASACCAFSSANADASNSTSQFEGVWLGLKNNAQFSLELKATASGALITVKRVTLRCTYAVAANGNAGQFDAFLTKGPSDKCANGVVAINVSGGAMDAVLPPNWGDAAFKLRQSEGPATGERVYPDVAIRGVRLGMPLNDAKTKLSQAMPTRNMGSSVRVAQSLKQFNGTYIQGALPYTGDYAGTDAAQDNVGVYQVGSSGAIAITRFTAPAPKDASTTDAFLSALQDAYGKPNTTQSSGPNLHLSWFYNEAGKPASGQALNACKQRVSSKTATRYAVMLFDILQFLKSTGRAKVDGNRVAEELSPQIGCGYTLKYQVRARGDGLLETAEAVLYDHRAVASAIWSETSKRLDDEIKLRLSNIKSAKDNKPEL